MYTPSVVVSSPERLFLDGLVRILEERFVVLAGSTDVREAISSARGERAAILLFDLRSLAEADVQFVLGAQSFGEFKTIGIEDGASEAPDGFDATITRSDSAETLLEKVSDMATGLERPWPRTRRRTSRDGVRLLSARETEVASLIAKGYTNSRIANVTGLKEQSVKNLISVVGRKLGCANRVQVALTWTRDDTSAKVSSQ